MAVPGDGTTPAAGPDAGTTPATGTTCRLPLPSRALLSAFSIVLISQHLYEAHRGNGCRRTDGYNHDQGQRHELPAQTFQFRRTPKVGYDGYHRHLVRHSDRASSANARIEPQPNVKQPQGNQYPEQHPCDHKMQKPRSDGGLRQGRRFLDLE